MPAIADMIDRLKRAVFAWRGGDRNEFCLCWACQKERKGGGPMSHDSRRYQNGEDEPEEGDIVRWRHEHGTGKVEDPGKRGTMRIVYDDGRTADVMPSECALVSRARRKVRGA